jgi:predicted phage-related endonuclease
MKTHSLIQGSPAWLAYRATHFNASDAPAMMGVSDYKTRTQLMHDLHTGMAPEVDAATQRRFDEGHRIEALARPLAEAIIEMELYPVTGSEGKLSASFDGLTMCESTGFEHKTLNESLRACMRDEGNGCDLPLQYQVQMEQQLMVSGAERILFMASKWDGDTLIEELHCWYASDPKIRNDILQGWTQFAIDLDAYVPTEKVAAPVGRTPETLPALHIEVTGMVTASNLAEYKTHALAVFGSINRELTTDAQFADAEKTVKWCADIEQRLAAAKQHALSQTESIDALFRTIDDISAEARATRLELDKLVKARKEAVRVEIVSAGAVAIAKHIEALNVRLGKPYMPAVPVDFAGAIKGKRTIDSLNDAVNTTLANAKIAASAIADRIQTNLNTLRELATGNAFLFSDAAQIVLKANDDLIMLVKSRISEHQAVEAKKEADQRERIRAEEVARLEREKAELDRVTAERARAEAIAREKAEAYALVTHEAVVEIMMPATVIEAMKPAPAIVLTGNTVSIPLKVQSFQAQATPPELKLGQMAERLGFTLTAAFLLELGFEHSATDKAAKLYHEHQWPLICAALIERIESACELQAA